MNDWLKFPAHCWMGMLLIALLTGCGDGNGGLSGEDGFNLGDTTSSSSSSSNSSGSSSGSINSSSSSSSSSSGGDGLGLPGAAVDFTSGAKASRTESLQEILEDLAASTAVCMASRLLLADMRKPPLYTMARGICVATDATGPEQAHYFSDAACSREFAFRPESFSGYCRELAAAGPNTKLGNAAAWRGDERQVNDPLPETPSRKWMLAHGTRLALTSEELDGKTIPFMKRLRYRDVVTSYDVRPLYWSCDTSQGCAPGLSRRGILLGYLKKSAGPGTVPLYWACISKGCTRRALATRAGPYGGSLLGYMSSRPRSGTLPLYWRCSTRFRSVCTAMVSPSRASAGNRAPLGYVYDKSVIKGTCSLEMRVYKKDLNATGLTPLLAFHGGSWRYRGGAFVGFEAQLAHYTEDGFVVFVPFYRLSGEADGNRDCNGAPWQAITADAEAALDWVNRHATAFGARPALPVVMGQSAGAHLAGWLLAHRPSQVAAGMLLYGPSDMRDFLTQAVPADGLYHAGSAASLNSLSRFFGSDVRAIDLDADTDFVRLNSYHDYVRAGGVPPVFLIHGSTDAVVPSNQSVLMCDAYGGNAQDDGGGAQRRAIYACDSRSYLHLFQQGGHGLDGCLRGGSGVACPAGDEQSRKLVEDSLREARAWLRSRVNEAAR